MDPNRLGLNFGGGVRGAFNNPQNYPASDGRVFPTTPSSFPQPVFPTQNGQVPNEYVNSQVQNPNAYGQQSPGGYFMNGPSYQSQYGQNQHAQYQNQYQSPNLQTPQSSFQPRPGYASDPTSGLARQFSNQNLGSNQRQASPFGRQPSPSNQRPRNGAGSAQNNYGSHLTPPATGADGKSEPDPNQRPPERNPDKYSQNVQKRGQALHASVEAFFKENITRARERNLR